MDHYTDHRSSTLFISFPKRVLKQAEKVKLAFQRDFCENYIKHGNRLSRISSVTISVFSKLYPAIALPTFLSDYYSVTDSDRVAHYLYRSPARFSNLLMPLLVDGFDYRSACNAIRYADSDFTIYLTTYGYF